jgi:hypothetical protein
MTFRDFADGEKLSASDYIAGVSATLRPFLGFALDGVTVAAQDNLAVDLFTSDTSPSTTNMSYDAGNDRYNCDTGSGTETCSMKTAFVTIANDVDNVIVAVDSSLAATSTLTIKASLNSGSDFFTVSDSQLTGGFSTGTNLQFEFTIVRTNTSSTDFVTGYASYYG